MSGDSLGVGNVLLVPILEYNVRSSEDHGRTVVVARHHCPDLDGWRRAVMIAGIACVASRFGNQFPAIWRLEACDDDNESRL